jgi:hypothetical protein
MTPKRIQRRRTKGWRMPENTVYVGRPTRWGNPYYIGRVGNRRRWTGYFVGEHGNDIDAFGEYATHREAAARAVEMYELHIGPMGNHELDVEDVRRTLAGKNLACWCPPEQPCHADVLLELANQPAGGAA